MESVKYYPLREAIRLRSISANVTLAMMESIVNTITIIVLHCLVNMEEFAVPLTMITAADVHRPILGNLAKFDVPML